MLKNKMHHCGEFLKSLYYHRQDGSEDLLIKVGILYCPTCNVYFITDRNVSEIKDIAEFSP